MNKKSFFIENGYLMIENIIDEFEINIYRNIYEDFLSNKINNSKYRSDLSGINNNLNQEKITQIMLPSIIYPELLEMTIHKKSLEIAKDLLGEDMELDFDMLIDKAPNSNTPTPWHQDCAYWLDMPDKRATSCWVALDDAKIDNGCMWYVPKSHLEKTRPHFTSTKGGALQCEVNESEGIPIELKAGSCVFHHGATLHYSRGNSTNNRRRAFITNFRPLSMIKYERERGYNHTGERKVSNINAKN